MPLLRRLTVILILLLFPALTLASGFSESVTALRGTSSTPLPDAINAVATAFLVLTTTLALIVIVLAGVQYMLSQGDEDKVETAKKTLVGAVMGLLVIGLSGAGVNCVLNMINGRGCGGGGGSASVAVRDDGIRTQTLRDDEGGDVNDDVFEDSGENGGGGGLVPQGEGQVGLCRVQCCLNPKLNPARPLCREKFTVSQRTGQCVCSFPVTSFDKHTEAICKSYGWKSDPRDTTKTEVACTGTWWELKGTPQDGCTSFAVTNLEGGTTKALYCNGVWTPTGPQASPRPSPRPQPLSGCSCRCEALNDNNKNQKGQPLCKQKWTGAFLSTCSQENQHFTRPLANATDRRCADRFNNKIRCFPDTANKGYVLQDNDLVDGVANGCSAIKPAGNQ